MVQEGYPVQLCCTLLGLSRSGFYAWRKRPAKLISAHELKLYYTAKDLFSKSRESLGSRELMKVLRKKHFNVGRAKTRSVMRKLKLIVRQRVACRVTTTRKPLAGCMAQTPYQKRNREFSNKGSFLLPFKAALNNLVEQYLVFAQGQAMRRIPMTMADWISKLDSFLNINDRDVLTHTGKVSHEMATQHAELEYEKFNQPCIQQADQKLSSFEKAVERIQRELKDK